MKINVLISTLNKGIEGVPQILLEHRPDVCYTIIHQITENCFTVPPVLIQRDDVRIVSTQTKGLSKSRNLALAHAEGDIGLLADDDVRYTSESFDIVRKAYQDHPELDIACFKIRTNDHEPEYKPYHVQPLTIEGDPPHFISSIETSFRISSLKKSAIQFDERFGLGSGRFIAGEEMIFVYDCLQQALRIQYFPEYIVRHPFESSGKVESREKYTAVGAVNARTKGYRSILITFRGFLSKLLRIFQGRTNPFLYLLYNLKGNFMILFKPYENRLRP